jgi:hypothetical protein
MRMARLEDQGSISVVVTAVMLVSMATFCYIVLARCLGIKPAILRLMSETLIYYASVQLLFIVGLFVTANYLNSAATHMEYRTILIAIMVMLLVGLCLTLLIWALGAFMLIRASPWNLIHGWKRVVLQICVTSALISIFGGLIYLSSKFSSYTLKAPMTKTVDIVDVECKIIDDDLIVTGFVHNNSNAVFKIKAIKARIGSADTAILNRKFYAIPLAGGPTYLKANSSETIAAAVPRDEALHQMILKGGLLECTCELDVEVPTGNFKKVAVQLPPLNTATDQKSK